MHIYDLSKNNKQRRQECLPAVAIPLILCVILEDFTIDEIPEEEQKQAQTRNYTTTNMSSLLNMML